MAKTKTTSALLLLTLVVSLARTSLQATSYNQDFIAHYEAILKKKDKLNKQGIDENKADAHYHLAKAHLHLGNYPQAIIACQAYIQAANPKGLELASTYQLLGNAHRKNADFKKAIKNYIIASKHKQLLVKDEKLPPNHPTVAKSYSLTAVAYLANGQYSIAYKYLKQSLETLGKNPEKNNHLFTILNALASYYNNVGNFDQAIKQCNVVIQATSEKQSPNLRGSIYNNLGFVYYHQGKYDLAIEKYKLSQQSESSPSSDHPDKAILHNNLAMVYNAQGHHEKALTHCNKALKLRIAKLRKNHIAIMISYNTQGSIYTNMQQIKLAMTSQENALAIATKLPNQNHPQISHVYHGTGTTYLANKEPDQASEYYDKARTIREDLFGEEHFKTASTYSALGDTFLAQKKPKDAQKWYEKALKIQSQTLPKQHPKTAMTLYGIAKVHQLNKQYKQAQTYFTQAMAMMQNTLGKKHPKMQSIQKDHQNLQSHQFQKDTPLNDEDDQKEEEPETNIGSQQSPPSLDLEQSNEIIIQDPTDQEHQEEQSQCTIM